MKGLTKDKTKKNPYKYNGEILKSTQFSPQPKSLVSTDSQCVTKTKKFYIGCYVCQNSTDNQLFN